MRRGKRDGWRERQQRSKDDERKSRGTNVTDG